MSEDREDPKALGEAARDAAERGDYASAARHLADAAKRQERDLGPDHPDLVNTLNNLGVVLERAGQPVEAEAAYRGAYAIARRVFAPDHPSVTTSATNLREFCEAHGVAFEPPAPQPVEPDVDPPSRSEPATKPTPAPAETPASAPAETPAPAPVAEPASGHAAMPAPAPVAKPDRRRFVRAVVASAMALIILSLLAWMMIGPSDQATTPAVGPVETGPREAAETPAARDTSAPVATKPAASSGPPVVVRAELCRSALRRPSVGEWTCTPAGASVRPGPLVYYTRIRVSAPVTVQHRWYRGDSLQQQVNLVVRPNTGGYRTYSRLTVDAGGTGQWRVEVRSQSGDLLHEQRFVVL